MLTKLIKNKNAHERARLKGLEIAKIKSLPRTARKDFDIEITSIRPISKGVEIYARAWKDGQQIGFGRDGSVDIERFVIINPPVLVEDSNGDVVKTWKDEHGISLTRKYREDIKEAILQSLEHTLSVKKERFDSKNIIPNKVGNTTTTVYPDADAESSTTDGRVRHDGSTWSSVHDATSGTTVQDNTTLNDIPQSAEISGTYYISRGFFYFDTSSISSSDSVTSATFSLVAESKLNTDSDGQDYITVVQVQGNNVSSNTGLTAADYDLCGDAVSNPTKGSNDVSMGGITANGSTYTDWTLNATGRGWIARSGESRPTGGTSGITYLGVREGHDIENVAVATSGNNHLNVNTADSTGTTKDPKLVIEHSTVTTVANAIFIGANF